MIELDCVERKEMERSGELTLGAIRTSARTSR
jgi:hypothetical protein